MPTEQCVFLILYIHSIYGILYMYITKYGCVFLKLAIGESIYVAMDLIPILLGSLPLAHNAQHSLVIKKMLTIKIECSPATYLTTGPGPGAVCGDASWSLQQADHQSTTVPSDNYSAYNANGRRGECGYSTN